MALFNLSLLLASTYAFKISVTPPTSPPSAAERTKVPLSDIISIRGGVMLMPIVAFIPCIAAIAVSIAAKIPSPTSSQILSWLLPDGSLPDLTPSRYLIISSVLCIIGGLGRIWCYRTLGRHFTFQLSLQNKHQLITSGPYAIVRHPSYTAIMAVANGLILLHLSPGSFMRSCGWIETVIGKVLFAFWVLQYMAACYTFFARTTAEDKMLRERFGEEWERYAEKVQYKLLPGVY
ncbi:hypothetical protein BJ138DRAFT_1099298 [Hygrophoropsis aurantiaca]|uniref:Uncharacterized protein n=1 Tax=Hygrophoropsis aurantiaca TaxID=72124 RepID=A0ACB8AM19_9AGAM|nr:hypothetical protein BJ138DRAFT_1099298 [Hygrophoropsis aurantiaca]